MFIVGLGATFFGFAIGIIIYRILRQRSGIRELSEIIALAGAIGGAAIFAFRNDVLFGFGWYSIGLVIGFLAYLAAGVVLYGKEEVQLWLPEKIDSTPTPDQEPEADTD